MSVAAPSRDPDRGVDGRVRGVGLLVLVNTALAWAAVERRGRATAGAFVVAGGAVAGALLVGWAHLAPIDAPTVPVAVVQGNIPQAVKWDAAFKAETLAIYGALTRAAAPGSRLVVWPEAAMPAYVRFEPGALRWLTDLAADARVPLLVGVPDAETDGKKVRYLNSAFLVESGGLRARYDKIHLVPFGEYVPLKRLLFSWRRSPPRSGTSRRAGRWRSSRWRATPFGTVICYEVIFPELFRGFVAEGASFMANITNDAWFGRTSGPWQHLAMLPLRAVENRDRDRARRQHRHLGVRAPVGRDPGTLPLGTRGTLRRRPAAPPGARRSTRGSATSSPTPAPR